MKSLKGRLIMVLAVALGLAGLVAASAMIARDRVTEREDARAMAEGTARNAAAFAAAQFEGSDHARTAFKIAYATSKAHEGSGVVVFGRSAKVLGAVPAKSVKIEYTTDPDCKECHLSGAATTGSGVGTRADGERVARSVMPIPVEASCKQTGCHPSVAKPLGYVYVQIPVAVLGSEARGALYLYVVGALALFALLGVLAYRFSSSLLISPVLDVVEYLRGLSSDRRTGRPMFDLPGEMAGALDGVETSLARLSEVKEKVPQLIDTCAASARVMHRLSSLLARNMDTEREYVVGLEKSLIKLSSDIKDVNSSVDLIAASADDNSTSLGEMTGSVKSVATDAEALSNHVKRSHGSVQQMVRSVQAVAEHVELLVARVDSASGRVGYIEVSAGEIAENARLASELSGEMAGSASVGADAVHHISESIKTSYREILVAADSMRELKKASRSVGDILKIINEINDKTKLLALNAAIIAAQAGEQGRSFAVVAHEIKGLSDRTAASTGDIARIIEAIQESVDKALGNVSKGEEWLGSSVDAVEQAGTLLGGIAETSADMFNRIKAIGDAAKRQSLLSNEVSDSVGQVAGMVDEIKRRVKEHSSSAENVESSAQAMNALTDQVRSAAKEQAETSRYLSEAFTIIDLHLKGVLKSFGANAEMMTAVIEGVNRAKARLDDCNRAVADADAALVDMERGFSGVTALVSGSEDEPK